MDTSFGAGDITVHRIVEHEAAFTDALEFLPGLTPEILAENRPWMQPAALEANSNQLVLCFQSYIVRTSHHTILIDTCIGNDKTFPARPSWHQKTDTTYMDGLAAAGLGVDDIDFVMCTHLHGDHVGWNTRLENGRWVPTFPRARYLFSERELAYWTGQHAATPLPVMQDSVLPVIAAGRADLVRSDHALDDEVRLMPTPGHTPDHFAVCVGRGRDVFAFTGDLIHSPIQARYPGISMRADTDRQQSAATRRGFLERYCDTDTICCTAHFPSPSRGRFTRWGDGFRCVPVEGR